MSALSYRFSHAIVRRPAASIIDGLRAIDHGPPDLALFQRHHRDYVAALEAAGITVTQLPALPDFPDSVFVEDTALCLPEAAIVMRPGAPSRLGEADEMAPCLQEFYDQVAAIKAPGHLEGGDILVTECEILVGLSARTNAAGVDQLRRIVAAWNYRVRIVETPAEILHFKTDCALLDEETILCTKRLSASGCFDGYRLLHTADGEEACANAIRCNDWVILPAGFPETQARLAAAGYKLKIVDNSEAAKLDGGMSCLSLRFNTARSNI